MGLAAEGQGAAAVPAARGGRGGRVARALRPRQGAGPRRRRRDRPGRAGARRARRTTPETSGDRSPYDEPDSAPRPYLPERARRMPRGSRREAGRVLQGLPRVALGEGARHLHAGARAEGRLRAARARVGHLLRRRRHPRGRAGLLPAPERPHPRLRRGDRLRHADDRVQRLHAQPAAGEPPAQIDDDLRERVNDNLEQVGVPRYSRHRRREALPLADRRASRSASCRRSPTRGCAGSRSRRSTAARSCARRS